MQIHGTANVWPWLLKWLENSASIRRLGVRVPFTSGHFLSLNLRPFHNNIRSWVENECCCPRTDNIQMLTLLKKISINTAPPSPVWRIKRSAQRAKKAERVLMGFSIMSVISNKPYDSLYRGLQNPYKPCNINQARLRWLLILNS